MNRVNEFPVQPSEGGESSAHGYQDQIAHVVTNILHGHPSEEEGRYIRMLSLFFEDLSYCVINPRVVHNIPDSMIEHPEFLSLLSTTIIQVAKRQSLKEIIFSIKDPSTDIPVGLKIRIEEIIKSNQEIQQYLTLEIAEMEKDGQSLSAVVKMYQTEK